jgi:uncharacterized protein (DUF1330 family)
LADPRDTAAMTVYFVVNSTITDPEGVDAYLAGVGPTLAGHDVQVLAAANDAETIEGVPAGPRLVILAFPDRDAFRAWYDSPAYQSVVGLRLAATSGFGVLAPGRDA